MKIGDKVVCIEKSLTEKNGTENKYYSVYPSWPMVGTVYVIQSFNTLPITTKMPGALSLNLVGYKCRNKSANVECGFLADRFRLLDDIKKQNSDQHLEEIIDKLCKVYGIVW